MTRRTLLAMAVPRQKPNILFIISDDQSWLHTGIDSGSAIKTTAYERVAREGVRFTNSYCSAPSCAPSRAAILTGQAFWRLEQGANMRAHLPAKFPVYPEVFEKAGYHVGYTGKGWGPGRLESAPDYPISDPRKRNPAGAEYANFDAFLARKRANQPFCFWFGSNKPHEPYPKSGRKSLHEAKLPPWMPDLPECRQHFLDYYAYIEEFDRELAGVLSTLDRNGLAENTLLVVTSDNGMSIPRAKTYLYDWGTRMPLAVRWPARVRGGRVADEFVSHTDFAATFLEAAGLPALPHMTGRSFLDVLDGKRDPSRDCAFTGRERHSPARDNAWGYPCRAVRTKDYLYIRNFEPDREPACTPPVVCDSESRFITEHLDVPAIRRMYELNWGKRPAEELYADSDQMRNVASEARYAKVKDRLSARLMAHLKTTGDPRVTGKAPFDDYPFWGSGFGRAQRNYQP